MLQAPVLYGLVVLLLVVLACGLEMFMRWLKARHAPASQRDARRLIRVLFSPWTTAALIVACVLGPLVVLLGSKFRPPRLDGNLCGVVRDPTGAPVAGARVVLVRTCGECGFFHPREVSVSSDARGSYVFERPYTHSALLTAFAENLMSDPLPVDLEAGSLLRTIDIRLLPDRDPDPARSPRARGHRIRARPREETATC